jgi:aminopeptidase
LFFNTLFDECASHIALGQCYSKCFVGGTKLSPQQIAAQGGNQSLIHIDWMIGNAQTDIRRCSCRWQHSAGLPYG